MPVEPTVIVAALRSDKPPLPTCALITPIALPLLLKVAPAAEVIETDGRLTAPVAATEPVPAAMVMPQVSDGELESVPPNETSAPEALFAVVSSTRSSARVNTLLKTIGPPDVNSSVPYIVVSPV